MILWLLRGFISELALCFACEGLYRSIAEFKTSVTLTLKKENPGKFINSAYIIN